MTLHTFRIIVDYFEGILEGFAGDLFVNKISFEVAKVHALQCVACTKIQYLLSHILSLLIDFSSFIEQEILFVKSCLHFWV